MDGQTNIELCAICGELSERLMVVEPEREITLTLPGGKRKVPQPPIKRWLCNTHADHAESAKRKAQQAERKRFHERIFEHRQSESTLFDVEPDRPFRHYEDEAA